MALNKHLLGTGRNGDLVERVVEAVLAAEFLADGCLSSGDAVERRVLRLAALHGELSRLLDVSPACRSRARPRPG